MKYRHRLISLFITIILAFSTVISFSSCKKKEEAKVRVGVLAGPTGMGMAKLIAEENAKENSLYEFHIYSDPSLATVELAGGSLDLLCLPTNTALNLSKKAEGKVISVAVNCLGSLYVVAKKTASVTALSDLSGCTVTASVPSSTTKPILDALFSRASVSATVDMVADHDALVALLAKGETDIAVLPEPKATAALMQNSDYEIKLNLSEEWSSFFEAPMTMGCLVANDTFLKKNEKALKDFLALYRDSVSFINDSQNNADAAQMIVDAGILPKQPIAKSALTHLYGSLVLLTGEEMKDSMNAFFVSTGYAAPNDLFYYLK